MAAVSVPRPVLQAASGWQQMAKKTQHWYDYLWLWPIIYFVLGFFNIFFAWLGMIDFMVPVLFGTVWRQQAVLQPLLRTRFAFGKAGRRLEVVA